MERLLAVTHSHKFVEKGAETGGNLASARAGAWALALVAAVLPFFGPFASRAFAQRGGAYTLDGTPPTTPASGFPGMFDSNVADKGSFVLDIPTLSADYGLTENVTIGTNGLFLGLLVAGLPSVYLKTRYRFLTTESLASSFTVYGGYSTNRVGSAAGKTTFDGYLTGASNNTTYYFSERSYLNAFFYYLKLGLNARAEENLEYQNTSITTLLAGASYQYWVTKWFGPQALVALSAYNSIVLDSSTISASASLGRGVGVSGFAFIRVLGEFRLGRWLLSPGLISFLGMGGQSSSGEDGSDSEDGGSGSSLSPWMSATVKW